jgi:hypothetical protein
MHILTAEDIEDYYDDEPEIIFCPACLQRGYTNRIGNKILIGNEPRPDNYEDLWECAVCGLTGDITQMAKEATIKNAVETVETPQDDKLKLESAHKRRKSKTRKVTRHIKKNIRQTNDPDILREIRQHGSDNVKILVDTNP